MKLITIEKVFFSELFIYFLFNYQIQKGFVVKVVLTILKIFERKKIPPSKKKKKKL